MAENYKHLYEQTNKMLAMYQDEIVPGFRKTIENMEKTYVEVVRCKDCKHYIPDTSISPDFIGHYCEYHGNDYSFLPNDFCSYGERKDNDT